LIRFLLDQGIPRSAVAPLVAAGWDVQHVADIGLSRASDLQIIETARADDRIICTLDADFHALLAVTDASNPTVIPADLAPRNVRVLVLQRVRQQLRRF
jgi:predicted nuclease of predicted toxin-antitoxin system